uniref:Mobile element protein n=1 Tax=uncultured bacterium esnapd8 TaxID=1366615 RepID=S5TMD4_9BACT|nr:mobile element protein [uncultured bacterium esnapd8]
MGLVEERGDGVPPLEWAEALDQPSVQRSVTRSLGPTGAGRTGWTMRWKPASNAFAITFSDRFPAAETY